MDSAFMVLNTVSSTPEIVCSIIIVCGDNSSLLPLIQLCRILNGGKFPTEVFKGNLLETFLNRLG